MLITIPVSTPNHFLLQSVSGYADAPVQTFGKHKYVMKWSVIVVYNKPKPDKVEISSALIEKKVYVHDPTLPRSARTNSKSTVVVTNRNNVRFEKLRIDNRYDYQIKIDAAETLPSTWKHAGLPPDGTFAPKHTHDYDDMLQDLYSDYDGFTILVMAACNLVMHRVAVSDNDQKSEKVKADLKLAKPLPPDRDLTNFLPPTWNTVLWDELDEERMTYVLGMLVRLFYRGDGETDNRNWREQELRKSIIIYIAGTSGTSQFVNFTSLCMALELAASFTKSVGVRPDDNCHKGAANLLCNTIHSKGKTSVAPISDLAKVCCKVFGAGIVERVGEYPDLNNRLKHYGNDESAKHFDSNVDDIMNIMRRARLDAAYFILLGLLKLYGTKDMPKQMDQNLRISSIILGMVEDCTDRHSAGGLDVSIQEKIQKLEEIVENKAVKSNKAIYDNVKLVLYTFRMLVKTAGILTESDGVNDIRTLINEYEDILPNSLKPSKHGLVGRYNENTLHTWLIHVVHVAVNWMDGGFGSMYTILHVAKYGRTSDVKCDPDVF